MTTTGVANWIPAGFPFGLNGMMAGYDVRPENFKDKEDYVSELIEKLDDGTQALIYKALYAIGHRIGDCDRKIAALKRKLEPEKP